MKTLYLVPPPPLKKPEEEEVRSDLLLSFREGKLKTENSEVSLGWVRSTGEFAGHGFRLNPIFDWRIGKDSHGEVVLVPTHRVAGK